MTASLPQLRPADPPSGTHNGDELKLRDLLHVVSSGRRLLAGFVVAGVLLGLFYSWAATPMYRADALVQIEKKSKSVTGSSDDLYELMAGRDSTSTEIELLKSRMVVGRVVDQLHLDVSAGPRHFPLVGKPIARGDAEWLASVARATFGLTRYAWSNERIQIGVVSVPPSLLNKMLTLRAAERGAFSLAYKGRELVAHAKVGEAAAFVTDDGPGSVFVRELAAEPGTEFEIKVARRLEVIQGLAKRLQIVERGRMSGILSISLEGSDPGFTTQIVNAIATAYQRQNVERRSAEAEQTLEFITQQLPRVRHDLETAENELNRYRLEQKSADLTKETELVLQQSVALEQTRLELQQKREEALRRFTPSHPVLQALDGQLGQVSGEQRNLAARVKVLPETQQELLRLSRDIQVNSTLYTALLNNAEQLRIAKAGTIGNIRVVDFAIEPSVPTRPAKGFVLALSLVAGVFFGLVAVFMRNALQFGVTDPAVLERAFALPAYAAIPFTTAQQRIGRRIERGESIEGILAKLDPDNPAIEAIRSLRTALHVDRLQASNNVLMICGPSPGLGKSFVSVNLAASMAMTGRRVVLMDADIRRGHLHQFVASSRDNGLTDYINGRCELERIVQPTQQENLFLVPTGLIPPNPSELLLSERFEKAIKWLSQSYDYVIVDSAPILAVTDAMIVGRFADTTLVVLKSGRHSLRQVEDTLKRMRTGRLTVKGIVLNQVGQSRPDMHGSRTGYYNYEYRPSKQ